MVDKELELKFIHAIADDRTNLHRGSKSTRPLTLNYDYIGFRGEWEFAREFGLPIDIWPRAHGDGGIDFNINGLTIDVKTSKTPFNLLREANRHHARVLVLAGYDETNDIITFPGWELDEIMVLQPTKTFGHGILNHYKPASLLRPMEELKEIIEKAKKLKCRQ